MCFIVPKKGVFEHQNEGVLDFYNLEGKRGAVQDVISAPAGIQRCFL